MGQEYNARSVRSGISVAIRMPAVLGVEPGADWTVVAQGDNLMLRRREPARRTIDVSGFAGKAPGILLAPCEDFEERPSVIAARKAAASE